MERDPRIDETIAAAPEFARPILTHLRELVHSALPGAEETIKWGMPHFMVAGKNVAGMNAFKAHCAFIVHGDGRQGDALGQYGKLATLADLPPDEELVARLHDAAARVAITGKATRNASQSRAPIAEPEDFTTALAAVPVAQATWDGFAPSHRRDYLEWIVEAKQPTTSDRRIAQSVEWLAEGKRRNWKYER